MPDSTINTHNYTRSNNDKQKQVQVKSRRGMPLRWKWSQKKYEKMSSISTNLSKCSPKYYSPSPHLSTFLQTFFARPDSSSSGPPNSPATEPSPLSPDSPRPRWPAPRHPPPRCRTPFVTAQGHGAIGFLATFFDFTKERRIKTKTYR